MQDSSKDSSVFSKWINSKEGSDSLKKAATEGVLTEEENREKVTSKFYKWLNSSDGTRWFDEADIIGIPDDEDLDTIRADRELLGYSEQLYSKLQQEIAPEMTNVQQYFSLLRESISKSENRANMTVEEWGKILSSHQDLENSFTRFREEISKFMQNIGSNARALHPNLGRLQVDFIEYQLSFSIDALFLSLLSPDGSKIGAVNQDSAIWNIKVVLTHLVNQYLDESFQLFYKGVEKKTHALFKTESLISLLKPAEA